MNLYTLPPFTKEQLALLDDSFVFESLEDSQSQQSGSIVKTGDIIEAVVTEISEEYIHLIFEDCISIKCLLFETNSQFLKKGDQVKVLLELQFETDSWEGSLSKAAFIEQYELFQEIAAQKAHINATINVVLRSGFAVEVDGMRAFVPGRESGIRFLDSFDAIGQEMTFIAQFFDEKLGQLVLSRREIAKKERKDELITTYENLSVDQRITGIVTSIKPFGVFVRFGRVSGLLHISEMSLQHVEDPALLVKTDQKLEVDIISIEFNRKRIGLSRKKIIREEQTAALKNFKIGSNILGIVSKIVDFGAFILLDDNIEGLCHISELSWTKHPQHPSAIVCEGEKVLVRLLSFDVEKQRVSLSIKQAKENPWNSFANSLTSDSILEGVISRIEKYGIFIQLTEEMEGLCHNSELSWNRIQHPNEVGSFEIGQKMKVKVLHIDPKKQRISLGIKQLTPDPWDLAGEKTIIGAIFTATIIRFMEKAALLEVAQGLEGRLYISDISSERIESIRSAVRIGQKVEVMTIASDRKRRKLDLSIKAVAKKREEERPKSFSDEHSMNPLLDAFVRSGIKRK